MRQTAIMLMAAGLISAGMVPNPCFGEAKAEKPASSSPVYPVPAETKVEPVSCEVVFILDTTSSMGGLIEGAKKKIWSIANDIVRAGKSGSVKIGLVPYRDRGDQYVTRIFDLSDDIDQVFVNLQGFKADGGGDGPESVNQALNEAVTRISWSDSPQVMRTIFLVGDYPPHMDYQDDVKYPMSCKLAAGKNIVINTVQCGNYRPTTLIWKEIASLCDGDYSAIEQSGGMVVVSTPYDSEIAAVTRKNNATIIPYGSAAQQAAVKSKAMSSDKAEKSILAARSSYNLYISKEDAAAPAVSGRGDLVNDAKDADFLKKLDRKELPAELKDQSEAQILETVQARQKERAGYNQQLAELNKKRAEYLRKAAAEKPVLEDSFDAQVRKSITRQLEKVRNTDSGK